MSARVWTKEELDRVHPLHDGFEWRIDDDGQPFAAIVRPGGRWYFACGWQGRCFLVRWEPTPVEVVLAVALAIKGLDSYQAMAAAMGELAHRAEMKAERSRPCSEAEAEWATKQATWQEAAAMLRRGTVQP